MMRCTQTPRVLSCALLCCSLAACGDSSESAKSEASRTAAATAPAADSIFTPPAERAELPADRINFTLTQHEWYARGEPLLHEGRAYRPVGMPVGASLEDMEPAGEYQGVEYFQLRGAGNATVYVAVYRGYWQPFRADTPVPR